MTTIKTFSSDIEGHVETYGDSSDKASDSFEVSPLARRNLYGKWMLLATGAGLDTGYKRVKGALRIEPVEVDKAADLFFAGKKITEEQEKILETGWPKMFKGVFSENFQGIVQDPEKEKEAKEFHWTQWEKAIPRDAQGKIDSRLLDEEKRAFEAYWRELQKVMQKLYIPGKSWGIKYGEFYHKDVGWYS